MTSGTDRQWNALLELDHWCAGKGLQIILLILGSILLSRLVQWSSSMITVPTTTAFRPRSRDFIPLPSAGTAPDTGDMTPTLKRTDAQLKNSVVDELSWIPGINNTHIGVTADHGSITLTGEVDSYPEKVLAGKAALGVRGVSALAQEITVHNLFGTLSDTDIAREAVEGLDRGIDVPDTVQASISHGVITLTGDVDWHYEREAAVTAVQHLRGVTDVHNQIAIRPSVSVTGVKAEIQSALIRNAQFEGEHVTVVTDSMGHLTLTGNVRSFAERQQAEAVAWSAPGVTRITNDLQVQS